jgi:hypothetical protein
MFLTESQKTKIKDIIRNAGLSYHSTDLFEYQSWRVIDALQKQNQELKRRIEKLEKKSSS